MAGGILWGFDGTLVDSEPLREAALVEALTTLGVTPPEQFGALVAGHDLEQIHAWCADHLGLALGLADWRRLTYRRYFEDVRAVTPREGAVELFIDLERHGRAQAIVSNADRLVVQANLEVAGLATAGRITVARNDVRRGKPAPEPYARAAWLLGVEAASCVVVEDTPTGAAAGVAAGMRTLFWPQGEAAKPVGAEAVADLATLARKLRATG